MILLFDLRRSSRLNAWIRIILRNLSDTLIQITAAESLKGRVVQSTHRCGVALFTLLLLLADVLPLLVLGRVHLKVQGSEYILGTLWMKSKSFLIRGPRGVLLLNNVAIELVIHASSPFLLTCWLMSLLVINELMVLRELFVQELHLHNFIVARGWVATSIFLVMWGWSRLRIVDLDTQRALASARGINYVTSLKNHFRFFLLFHIFSHRWNNWDPACVKGSFTNFANVFLGLSRRGQI